MSVARGKYAPGPLSFNPGPPRHKTPKDAKSTASIDRLLRARQFWAEGKFHNQGGSDGEI
jgi:hypothetical protein